MGRVEGKVALITGALRGIGAETARLLAREGAKVILTDLAKKGDPQLLNDTNGCYYSLDVSSERNWEKVMSEIESEFGRIDILFNNAGITGLEDDLGPQDPEHASTKSWHWVHQVNLDGVFFGCKYGIGLMKEHGGSIINMSSRSGLVGIPDAAAYASSKAAVRNHTKSVALYCAKNKYHI